MKKIITQHELKLRREQSVVLKPGYRVLDVALSLGRIWLFVLEDAHSAEDDNKVVSVTVVPHGEDFELKEDDRYIETIERDGHNWHVFVETEPEVRKIQETIR